MTSRIAAEVTITSSVAAFVIVDVEPLLFRSDCSFSSRTYFTVNDKGGTVVTGVAFDVVLVVVRVVVRGMVRGVVRVPVPVAITSTETESASAWN